MEFLINRYFLLALTFGAFLAGRRLQRWAGGTPLLNPILLAIMIVILWLVATGTPHSAYQPAGDYIDFWLKPALVALGVPLSQQLKVIRRQLLPILLAETIGCLVGIVSVVLFAEAFGASREVLLSLVPKSVTTPIAIEVSQTIGGIPALTAAVVVATGIFGSMAGFKMMSISRIKSPIAQGLSMGTAAHAVGTSAALDRSARYGAFSSLGLILNGLLTAILAPSILALMGYGV
ncbi:MAG: LrgB family protein [Paramuribaculum sp.]|nr:LrgB family protein [Paramuribaculum sp.]